MLGLIAIIIASVKIGEEAKRLKISSVPYILGAIFLAIVPAVIVQLMFGRSIPVVIITSIMTIAFCFIPYNMLKNEPTPVQNNESNPIQNSESNNP